jgi:hypothetical protein
MVSFESFLAGLNDPKAACENRLPDRSTSRSVPGKRDDRVAVARKPFPDSLPLPMGVAAPAFLPGRKDERTIDERQFRRRSIQNRPGKQDDPLSVPLAIGDRRKRFPHPVVFANCSANEILPCDRNHHEGSDAWMKPFRSHVALAMENLLCDLNQDETIHDWMKRVRYPAALATESLRSELNQAEGIDWMKRVRSHVALAMESLPSDRNHHEAIDEWMTPFRSHAAAAMNRARETPLSGLSQAEGIDEGPKPFPHAAASPTDSRREIPLSDLNHPEACGDLTKRFRYQLVVATNPARGIPLSDLNHPEGIDESMKRLPQAAGLVTNRAREILLSDSSRAEATDEILVPGLPLQNRPRGQRHHRPAARTQQAKPAASDDRRRFRLHSPDPLPSDLKGMKMAPEIGQIANRPPNLSASQRPGGRVRTTFPPAMLANANQRRRRLPPAAASIPRLPPDLGALPLPCDLIRANPIDANANQVRSRSTPTWRSSDRARRDDARLPIRFLSLFPHGDPNQGTPTGGDRNPIRTHPPANDKRFDDPVRQVRATKRPLLKFDMLLCDPNEAKPVRKTETEKQFRHRSPMGRARVTETENDCGLTA